MHREQLSRGEDTISFTLQGSTAVWLVRQVLGLGHGDDLCLGSGDGLGSGMLVTLMAQWGGARASLGRHVAFAVSFAGSMGSRRNSGCRTDHMSAVAWCCRTHPPWCGVESSVAQPYLAAVSRSVVGTAQRPERRLACVGMTDGLVAAAVA